MERRHEPLSFDDALEAVADPRRRRLLLALLGTQSQDLSAAGGGEAAAAGDYPVLLYHVHLPKLEALGLVRHDEERETVTRGPAFDEMRPLLALFDDHWDDLAPGW